MSRQAAIIVGVVVIALLLLCNIAVAAYAVPRLIQFVQFGAESSTAQSVAPSSSEPAAPRAAQPAPATPTPGSRGPSAPQNPAQPPNSPSRPPFQITVVIPGGGSGAQALPTPTAGPSPTIGPSPTPWPTVQPLVLSPQEQALAALYNRTSAGVVIINIGIRMPGQAQANGTPTDGGASGFVWDKQGHIVTNYHVVADASVIQVTLWDDTSVAAKVIGTDADSDLAVIQIDVPADKLVPLELADSDQVRVGQTAVAVGNPFLAGTSMTLGIVSGLGRSIQGEQTWFTIPDAIQTDAAINPGNSGGPLLDGSGRVIGINEQIRSETRANSGVGFAIPVNIVKLVVPDLIAKGSHSWPYLGASGVSVNQQVIEANNLKVSAGAYIDDVVPGGAAAKAGIHGSSGQARTQDNPVRTGGDVIVAVDNVTIRKFDDLLRYLTLHTHVGQTLELTVIRGGQELKVPVVLQERPRMQQRAPGRTAP